MTADPPSARGIPTRPHEVDTAALLTRLAAADADDVRRLVRERDSLALLHEALRQADAAESLETRLRVFAGAVGRIGFRGVTVTIDDPRYGEALVVRVGEMPGDGGPSEPAASGDASGPLAIPLRARDGRPLGTLVLGGPLEGGGLTLAQVRTIELLARQMAQSVEQAGLAELIERSERDRQQSEALAEIARAVSGSLRLGEVLPLVLRHANALLRTRGACVLLREGEGLNVVAAAGDAEPLSGMRVPVHGSMTGRAVLEGACVIANDMARDDRAYGPARHAARVSNTLVAPLVTGAGAIGAISVINRDAGFTAADAHVLQRLAHHVAVAIVNARLFEQVADATREWMVAFDAMPVGLAVLDEAGRVRRGNASAAQIAGVASPRDLLGRDFHDAVLQDGADAGGGAGGPVEHALAGRGPVRGIVRSASRGVVLDVVASPHPSGGAVVTFDDVTVHHELAERVAQSEARYSRLVESAADAIFTVDARARFTSVNRALEIATGRRREELIGTPAADLLDARDREPILRTFASTMAGARQRTELRYPGPDGEERCASLTASPIVEEGTVVGALAVVRDVTDERRLMEQLVQQEKLAAIGQLVSGVAHELNNPLAAVTAFAQILLATPDVDGEQRQSAMTIYQEARRAAKIVSNLLTFARQHRPERRPTDLNQVLSDTLELRRYAIRMAQIELDVALDPDLPLTWADPFQLQQVLLNLITNAEHALATWDGPRRIALQTAHAGGTLSISVRDGGPGIGARDLDRVFNPFYTTKPVGEGTGLGLSISDGIVREHGGRIRVESAPGEGAQFTVEMPIVDPLSMMPPRVVAPGAE